MTTTHAEIGLGAKAPDAELRSDSGSTVFLSSFWDAEPAVLVLLNDLELEAAADHAITLRDVRGAFDEAGGDIVVVARNAPGALAAFRFRNNIGYALLSDGIAEVHEQYGVRPNSSASFVIDTGGVIRYAHRGNGPLDAPPTWTLIDAVCGITGEVVARPEPAELAPAPFSLHGDAAERLAFVTGAPVTVVDQVRYTCSKCSNNAYEVVKLSTSGGWLSRIFNFEYRNFVAVVCTACSHAELYRTKGGALANIADILMGS
jgi:predicted nucleic-acid-binding Zn-ribbon protein/peroxiredoxin